MNKGAETHTQVQEFSEYVSSFARSNTDSRQIAAPPTLAGFGIIIILLAFTPQNTTAQQDKGDAYRDLITEALHEYKLGNWEEARTLFKKAHRVNPNARTLRGLGMASFEARRYVEAFIALQGSLNESRKPLTQQQRTEVTKLVERTEQFIGRRALRIHPESAVITIDGGEAVVREGFLLLNPGRHEIIAKAEGYQAAIQQIEIDGGSSSTLELALKPMLKSETGSTISKPQPDKTETTSSASRHIDTTIAPSKSRLSVPGVVLTSIGTAGIITGIILVAIAESRASDLTSPSKDTVWTRERDDDYESVTPLRIGGGIGLGVGTALAAVGIYLLLDGLFEEQSKASSTVQLSEKVTPRIVRF